MSVTNSQCSPNQDQLSSCQWLTASVYPISTNWHHAIYRQDSISVIRTNCIMSVTQIQCLNNRVMSVTLTASVYPIRSNCHHASDSQSRLHQDKLSSFPERRLVNQGQLVTSQWQMDIRVMYSKCFFKTKIKVIYFASCLIELRKMHLILLRSFSLLIFNLP